MMVCCHYTFLILPDCRHSHSDLTVTLPVSQVFRVYLVTGEDVQFCFIRYRPADISSSKSTTLCAGSKPPVKPMITTHNSQIVAGDLVSSQ